MVRALLEFSEHTNRLLNIVKAKYGLRTKAQAVEKIAEQYEQTILEPSLRPEFVEEAEERVRKGKFRKIRRVLEVFEPGKSH